MSLVNPSDSHIVSNYEQFDATHEEHAHDAGSNAGSTAIYHPHSAQTPRFVAPCRAATVAGVLRPRPPSTDGWQPAGLALCRRDRRPPEEGSCRPLPKIQERDRAARGPSRTGGGD